MDTAPSEPGLPTSITGKSNAAAASQRVGVIGLGHMGRAFAHNLIADAHQVVVYDRDPKLSLIHI